MKTLAISFLFSTFIFCSFLNIGNGGKIDSRSWLDDLIKNLLNSTFQDLKNLTIPEVAFKIDRNGVNVSFSANLLAISNLENIQIEILQTSLLPLRVKNITLKLDSLNVAADVYDLSGVIVSGSLQGPVELFGNGKARIDLEDISLTAAIDFTSHNNTLQIKDRGIKGFDFNLERAQFALENLLGDPEMGEVINVFLSFFLPYVIADFKQEFFDTYQDQIIDYLNELLKHIDFP